MCSYRDARPYTHLQGRQSQCIHTETLGPILTYKAGKASVFIQRHKALYSPTRQAKPVCSYRDARPYTHLHGRQSQCVHTETLGPILTYKAGKASVFIQRR